MLREGVINTQREGRGGVCTGSSTLRESFENRFVCISPVKNPFENRFVCISPAKNPFENRFVCTFLVKNPFENRFVCIFPVKDPFENPFGSRFTLCPALIQLHIDYSQLLEAKVNRNTFQYHRLENLLLFQTL